jgi:hypothetical protein
VREKLQVLGSLSKGYHLFRGSVCWIFQVQINAPKSVFLRVLGILIWPCEYRGSGGSGGSIDIFEFLYRKKLNEL